MIPERKRRVPLASSLLVLLSLLLILGFASGLAGAVDPASAPAVEENETPDAKIENVSLSGDGYIQSQHDIVRDHPGPPYVWQSEELVVNVNVSSEGGANDLELCGRAYNEDNEQLDRSDCTSFSLENGSQDTVQLTLSDWPENATGNHTIVLQVGATEIGDDLVVSESTIDLVVIEKDGDLTGDGLKNAEEVEHGTDFTTPDTDGDGLTDWQEVKNYGTDPLRADTTGDGISDGTLARWGLDPTEPYVAHVYVGGGILLAFALIVGANLHGRRFFSGRGAASDGPPADASPGAAEPVAADGTDDPDAASSIDESLLTSEEHVCRLLAQNDGRMKQKRIVETTGWSKAKVSRVVSTLEDEERVRKLRIGRENVVEMLEEPTTREEQQST